MTQEQIINKSQSSPALTKQVKSQYPAKFKGRIPLRIMITKTIIPENAHLTDDHVGILAGGEEYYVWVNNYGYVYAIMPNGKQVRLKPDEYDVIEWHKQINQKQ